MYRLHLDHALAYLALASSAITALTVEAGHKSHTPYNFRPETDESYWKWDLPVLFNFSTSQAQDTIDGKTCTTSYWSSSFLTSTKGHQYFVLSHAITDSSNSSNYQASILNLDNPHKYYSQVAYFNGSILKNNFPFKATMARSGFESLSEDNISQMRTWSDLDRVKFDIKFNASSKILVDGGSGLFTFGTGVTYEWGLPSCRTEGSLTIDGEEVIIDPERSLTWYDRQWNNGLPNNWTWFELHVPGSQTKFSIWAIDNKSKNQNNYFAAIRLGDGSQNLIPVSFSPDYTRRWHSSATGITYAQDWVLVIGDYATLHVSSVVGNQEIPGNTSLSTIYEGFATFKGVVEGKQVEGFGLVEMFFPG